MTSKQYLNVCKSLKSTRLVDVVLYWRATYSCSQMILLSSPSKGTWRLLKFNFSKRLLISPDYFHKIHSNWTRTRPKTRLMVNQTQKKLIRRPGDLYWQWWAGNNQISRTLGVVLDNGICWEEQLIKVTGKVLKGILFFGALVITKTISSWKISNTAWWNCTFPRPTGYLKRQSLQQNLHTAKNQ